jgi:hypothetical protein
MEDQFLDMNDEDIDNLLFGINISDEKPVNDTICIACKRSCGNGLRCFSLCILSFLDCSSNLRA